MTSSSAMVPGRTCSGVPLDAAERTARLLGLIPWVAARGSASIGELEARFDYPRNLLLADLTAMTVDEDEHSEDGDEYPDGGASDNPFAHVVTIDWLPDDERVHVRCPRWLSDPMRLNGDEAARLLAVGEAALSMDIRDDVGDVATPALLRALTKLQLMLDDTRRGLNTRARYADLSMERRFDVSSDASISVRLGDAPESTLVDLRRAVRRRKRVEIEYYSYARDELTARAVDPSLVFSRRGTWYFSGWCHRAGAERVFRIDRLRSLRVTDTDATAAHGVEDLPTFDPRSCDRMVTIRLDRQAKWVAEYYPVLECRETDDGRLEMDLGVSVLPWLARLLLQLGPHAEVVSEDPEVAALRSSAASRVLERYR